LQRENRNIYYYLISGKQTWYSGWKAEYTGFHTTQYKTYGNKDYVCLNKRKKNKNKKTRNSNNVKHDVVLNKI